MAGQPSTLPTPLRMLSQRFVNELTTIKEGYVQRDTAVDVVALALLSREHVLLIGPPGTAKTALIERIAAMLGTDAFTYLLTKFTEPAELFGAIDVRSFQERSVYEVNTTGMLPAAKIAFLDEIFNGSSAILNTLLTLINERKFQNGSRRQDCELITLLGAANEMSDDPVLQAFCDRFLFRCRLGYVGDDVVEDVLDIGWAAERRLLAAETTTTAGQAGGADSGGFALADLATLQRAIASIDLSPIRHQLGGILRSLREEVVAFSDRRAVKAQKAIAAHALLGGRAQAQEADLGVLAYLWSSPHDDKTLRRIIEIHGIPLPADSAPVRDVAEIERSLNELTTHGEVASEPEDLREVLRRLGQLLAETRAGYPDLTEMLRRIQQAQRAALEKLRESEGDLYV